MDNELRRLNEFKHHMMEWSTMELSEEQIDNIVNSVDSGCYATMEELENDFSYDDNLLMFDTDLHSVVESYSEIYAGGRQWALNYYYLVEDEMFAGVFSYQY